VKRKKMKKIGIILAALVITTFLVGAVAANPQNNPPDQREKFCEKVAVQGTGEIYYAKTILDKEIAVDVEETMMGAGDFAMTVEEVLNEGARLEEGPDPVLDPDFNNFMCKKMVQFENGQLVGEAKYSMPGFHGGNGAIVREAFNVTSLQKDDLTTMKTTSTFTGVSPYNAQVLDFATKDAFEGLWGTDSTWRKICQKDIHHEQMFFGDFQVDKQLIFKEEVTKPCPEKNGCICGDC
jgi:hypothetical protein